MLGLQLLEHASLLHHILDRDRERPHEAEARNVPQAAAAVLLGLEPITVESVDHPVDLIRAVSVVNELGSFLLLFLGLRLIAGWQASSELHFCYLRKN